MRITTLLLTLLLIVMPVTATIYIDNIDLLGAKVVNVGNGLGDDDVVSKAYADASIVEMWTQTDDNATKYDGRVGIGTHDPQDKLEVSNGTFMTNISLLTQVDSITASGDGAKLNNPRIFDIQGSYLYVPSFGTDTLTIFDISDPTNIWQVSYINDSDTYASGTADTLDGAYAVQVVGDYAYVTAYHDSALTVIDVSNKTDPQQVGHVNDSSIGGTATNLRNPQDVQVAGKYAYVASQGDEAVSVIDISDPTSPREVSSVTGITDTARLFVEGELLYATSPAGDSSGALVVIDISDPENIEEIARLTDDISRSLSWGRAVYVEGGIAYMTSLGGDTVALTINVSNPNNMEELDTAGSLSLPMDIVKLGNTLIVAESDIEQISAVDVSDPANINTYYTVDTSNLQPYALGVKGKYLFVTLANGNAIEVYEIEGIETMTAEIGSLEADIVHVEDSLVVTKALNALTTSVGRGGITTTGPVAFSNNTFVITANGSVGINKKEPEGSLHVRGDTFINFTGLKNISDIEEGVDTSYMENPFSFEIRGDYAYVIPNSEDGMTILDISNPNNIFEVGQIRDDNQGGTGTALNGARFIALSGDVAFVTSNTEEAITAINISDPSNPTEMSYVQDHSQTGGVLSHADNIAGIQVVGSYAYVAGQASDALSVIDVSDPYNMTQVGVIADEASPDGAGDATLLDGAFGVKIEGSLAYVAANGDDGICIIDISDPYNPIQIGQINDSSNGGTASYMLNVRSLAVEGPIIYVPGYNDDGFVIVNVSDPTNPEEIANVSDSDSQDYYLEQPFDMELVGDYLFVGAYGDADGGINIFNVKDPVNPEFVTAYPYDRTRQIKAYGEKLYVADTADDTFEIYDLGGIDTHAARVGSLAATQANVDMDVTVDQNLKIQTGANFESIHSERAIVSQTGFAGNPYLWAAIVADQTASASATNFGTGVDEQVVQHGIVWGGSGVEFPIGGIYRIEVHGFFWGSSTTADFEFEMLKQNIDKSSSVLTRTVPRVHSSVDPTYRAITWVGEVKATESVTVRHDSLDTDTIQWLGNSSIIVERIG